MIFFRTPRGFLACLLAAGVAGAAVAQAQTNPKRPTPPKPAAAPTTGRATPAPAVLPEVIATVDGDSIHKGELQRVSETVAGSEGKAMKDFAPAQQTQIYGSVLDNMIMDKLLTKAANDEVVDPLTVYKRYDALATQYPNPQAFEAQLKKAGQTPDMVRQSILKQTAQEQWLEKQIAGEIKVTPQEVEKFYKESPPGKFDQPEIIHAEHLLVAARKDAPPEDALHAEEKALALLERVKKGEAFEDVARKESDDKTARAQLATEEHPASAGNGGDLGWFTADRIMPEFSAAVVKMKPGEVGGPVRTQFGYHLIKLLERKPASTATLDEAREQIAAYLVAEKRRIATSKVVAGLRDRAKIETFLPKAG